MKGRKLDPPDGTSFDFEGFPLFDPFWYMFALHGEPKLDVLKSPNNLLKSRWPNPELHEITQTGTEIGNKGCEQGRPPKPRLQKSYPFWTPKTNPLRTSLAPTRPNH